MRNASARCTVSRPASAPGVPGGGLRQRAGEHRVDLHGVHVPGDRQQPQGQRAEARPDLQGHVVGGQAGGGDDPTHGVRVVHEVLAQLLGGRDAQPGGEFPDLRRAEETRRSQCYL